MTIWISYPQNKKQKGSRKHYRPRDPDQMNKKSLAERMESLCKALFVFPGILEIYPDGKGLWLSVEVCWRQTTTICIYHRMTTERKRHPDQYWRVPEISCSWWNTEYPRIYRPLRNVSERLIPTHRIGAISKKGASREISQTVEPRPLWVRAKT